MKEIPLTRDYVALVDSEDFERMGGFSWSALVCSRTVYARRDVLIGGKKRTLLLHREVLGLPPNNTVLVDHINDDGLDCQKANLRICSYGSNLANQRPRGGRRFKGVTRLSSGRWVARITVDYREISLGCFGTEVEAALAFDTAAKQFRGEFARLNFPQVVGETSVHRAPENGDATWTNHGIALTEKDRHP